MVVHALICLLSILCYRWRFLGTLRVSTKDIYLTIAAISKATYVSAPISRVKNSTPEPKIALGIGKRVLKPLQFNSSSSSVVMACCEF